jgi:nitrate/nitrite-specific signal transduction histidine kinase
MTFQPRTRLYTRILMWSFVPAAVILFAVACTIYLAYQRVTEELVVGRNQQLTHLSAGQLAADLNPYVDTLDALTRSPGIYTGGPASQSAALLQAANQLLVFDGGAVILDPQGKVVSALPEGSTLVGEDWSSRSFFRQILRGGAATFSDVIVGGIDHPSVVAVAVPILNPNGEFRGALAGIFQVGATSTSAFYGGIVKLRLGQNGSTFLVDSAGRVIYHPDAGRIGKEVGNQPDVKEALKGQAGTLRTRNAEGLDILATFAPVPGTPWSLVTEENWTSLLASTRGYGQFLFLLLALGILLPTVHVVLGIRRITQPVGKLIAAAKEIASGKYGEQVSIRTGDELEELGEQFNKMSTELQQSYAQLEERVKARTKELATLNATAAVASHSLNLQEILQDALDKTLEVLGMEAGGAYCLEDSTLMLLAQHGRSEEFIRQASPRPIKGSVVEQAASAAQPLVWPIEDFPEHRLKPLLEREGMAQIICVPLMAKRKLVGAFTLGTSKARCVAPEELSLLAAIGQQIGVAVENAHLYQQAEETAAAAERTRLARELHDAVTQTLFSASLIAEVLPDLWEMNENEGRRRLEDLRQLTRGALAEMRTLLVELRPNALIQVPLPDLVRQLCESLVGRVRLPIDVSVAGQRKLPPDVQVGLYRITQEALNNVVKHSKATQAVVTLRLHETVRLSVADDGCGFEPSEVPPDHLGLKIMRERAEAIGARIAIQTEPGEGTQVTVTWKESRIEGEAG